MQITERFEKVNIDNLVPYARNARNHQGTDFTASLITA